jgi:hypothetical protein
MAWGSQSWVRLTKEATFGTFDASAIAANIVWARLHSNNGCTIRSTPQRQVIRSADGLNRRRQVVASRKVVAGNLNTLWYPTQSAFFLGAALTLTSNDLASYTIDFWDTIQVHRFLGCKLTNLHIAGTAQADYIPLTTSWVGQSKSTATLADPGVTVFPTEIPYTHIESKGLLSIGGTVTKYSALGVTVKNMLDCPFDEDQWVSNCTFAGRDIDLDVRLQYAAATLRTAFDAQSALTVSAAWARAAGLTSTIDLKTKDYVANVADDLALDKVGYQQIGIQCFYDQSATTDASFTVA